MGVLRRKLAEDWHRNSELEMIRAGAGRYALCNRAGPRADRGWEGGENRDLEEHIVDPVTDPFLFMFGDLGISQMAYPS